MSSHIFTILTLGTLVVSQAVKPDRTFDCTNSNFQVIYTACVPGDYSACCAVGTECCAGGCCDYTSMCLGRGTDGETCCDVSDPTLCGFADAPLPAPSVVCTGSTGLSSYNCPPGAKCDSRNDGCFPADDESDSGGNDETSDGPDTEETEPPKTVVVTAGGDGDSSDEDEPKTVTLQASSSNDSGDDDGSPTVVTTNDNVATAPSAAGTDSDAEPTGADGGSNGPTTVFGETVTVSASATETTSTDGANVVDVSLLLLCAPAAAMLLL